MNKNHDHSEVKNLSLGNYSESYVKLAKDRIIFLAENFSAETASDMSALLFYYDNISNDDITIYIHSNGGNADALTNIYDVIQMIESPITTICLGKAYSAGAVLLATGTKGNRYISKNARVMIHGMQCAFPILGHDISNSKNYYNFLDDNNDNIMKILSKHTGQPLSKLKEDCKRDVWLDAKQAKEYGVVDHILF
jgi:ATP-dependent Clp protease, protease subunit